MNRIGGTQTFLCIALVFYNAPQELERDAGGMSPEMRLGSVQDGYEIEQLVGLQGHAWDKHEEVVSQTLRNGGRKI